MDAFSCKKCGETPGAEALIPLWDGHVYCRGCVDAACPGLADYAVEHPTFEDSIPYDRAGALREVYAIMVFFGVGVATLAAVLFAASGADASKIPLIAAMVGLMLIIILLTLVIQLNSGPRRLPRVRIGGGHVEVFRQSVGGERFPSSRYEIADCRWHLGWLGEDSAARSRYGVIVTKVPAVLLKAPRMPAYPVSATGSTPEIRDRLVGFLRLAGIPERR